MRKFKSLEDARRHALRSGAQLEVDGAVFNRDGERIELQRRPPPPPPAPEKPAPEKPQPQNEQSMMIAHAAYTKASNADAQIQVLQETIRAQQAEITRLSEQLSKQPTTVEQPEKEDPVEWKFSVSRNDDGQMTGITAKAVAPKKSMSLADKAIDILESRSMQ